MLVYVYNFILRRLGQDGSEFKVIQGDQREWKGNEERRKECEREKKENVLKYFFCIFLIKVDYNFIFELCNII